MVGDEPMPPYQRPPLSKAYLMGTMERERLFLKPDAFYAEAEMRADPERAASRRSTARARRVRLVRRPHARLRQAADRDRHARAQDQMPGADLAGRALSARHRRCGRAAGRVPAGQALAIVGGGYIGLEVAAVARKRGLDVTVFEAMDRVMARAVSTPVSEFYERVHREAGVKLHAEHRRRSDSKARQASSGVRAGGKMLSRRYRAGRHRRRAE